MFNVRVCGFCKHLTMSTDHQPCSECYKQGKPVNYEAELVETHKREIPYWKPILIGIVIGLVVRLCMKLL